MTTDLPSHEESDKSTMCASCAGIQQNWRRARGHAELVQGSNRTVAHTQGSVTITRYRCEACGTIWEYENDKTNRHAGWSVLGRPAS